jgi:hypothetical protein
MEVNRSTSMVKASTSLVEASSTKVTGLTFVLAAARSRVSRET